MVQRLGLLLELNDDKSGLALRFLQVLHAEADLSETRFMVGFQLGFFVVESCLPIFWVFGLIGAPIFCIIVEGFLKLKGKKIAFQ